MDAAKLQAHLTHECDLVVLQTTTSTNDEIKQRLAQKARAAFPLAQNHVRPLIVVSARQTAGRGRLGRAWASPQGGVYLSLLLQADTALENSSVLPLVVALGVREALESLAPHTTVRIKWPNDVVCPHGKLAGILVEGASGAAMAGGAAAAAAPATALDFATAPAPAATAPAPADPAIAPAPAPATAPVAASFIVGIGSNVSRPERGAFEGAAYLSEHSTQPPTREQTAAAVINAVLGCYQQWQAAAFSFAPFATCYQQQLSILNQDVVVRTGGGEPIAEGRVTGIDSCGRLQLLRAGQVVSVAAGDVTLRSS